jgi:hypothetical protein
VKSKAAGVLGFSNLYVVKDWEKLRPIFKPQVWVAECSILSNPILLYVY